MYVALTRARDVLEVYVPLRYHHKRHALGDKHSYAPVSRFLSPIRDLFDEVAPATFGDELAADLNAGFSVADEVNISTAALWQL
jgi:hypothetical protein